MHVRCRTPEDVKDGSDTIQLCEGSHSAFNYGPKENSDFEYYGKGNNNSKKSDSKRILQIVAITILTAAIVAFSIYFTMTKDNLLPDSMQSQRLNNLIENNPTLKKLHEDGVEKKSQYDEAQDKYEEDMAISQEQKEKFIIYGCSLGLICGCCMAFCASQNHEAQRQQCCMNFWGIGR